MTATIAPWWFTARAAGLGALVAASLSVSLGLIMALRLPEVRGRMSELVAAHEALALLTFALIGVHGVALVFDPVLDAGPLQVLVPFASPFEPLAAAFGQLAALGMLGLGATFYVRRRLGIVRWRKAHRLIPAFWALAALHGALIGTDGLAAWSLVATLPPIVAALVLLAARWLAPGRATPPRRAAA